MCAYDDAVRSGLAQVRVTDPLNEVWRAQSAQEAYVATLLVELANPYGRGERELNWVVRWAQRFAPYCTLDAGIEGHKPSTYGIDTDGDSGLRPLGLLHADPHACCASTAAGSPPRSRPSSRSSSAASRPPRSGSATTAPPARARACCCRSTAPGAWPPPDGVSRAGRNPETIDFTGDWLAIGYAIRGELFQQPVTEQRPRAFRDDISLLTFGERVRHRRWQHLGEPATRIAGDGVSAWSASAGSSWTSR